MSINYISKFINPKIRFVAFRSANYSSLVAVSATNRPADFVPCLRQYFRGVPNVSASGDTVFVDFE